MASIDTEKYTCNECAANAVTGLKYALLKAASMLYVAETLEKSNTPELGFNGKIAFSVKQERIDCPSCVINCAEALILLYAIKLHASLGVFKPMVPHNHTAFAVIYALSELYLFTIAGISSKGSVPELDAVKLTKAALEKFVIVSDAETLSIKG